MAKTVRDPRGGTWKVRRVWFEKRSRFPGTALIRRNNPAVGLILVPVLLSWLFTIAFEFIGELVSHVLRRRDWVVEARLDTTMKREILRWRVRGLGASRAAVDAACTALSQGVETTRFG